MRFEHWGRDFVLDVRDAARQVRHRPAFAFAVILTFAIGIGANAASFSLANAVLFRPLSPVEPEQVVRLYSQGATASETAAFSYPDFIDIASRTRTLSSVGATHLATIALVAGGQRDQLLGEIASSGYFDVRQLRMAAGRMPSRADDRRGAPLVVMLSHKYWQRRFGGDSRTVGLAITVNNRPATVVGIADARAIGSFIGAPVDAWLPLEPALDLLGARAAIDRSRPVLTLLGRLAPGVTAAQATSELAIIDPVLREAHREPALRLGLGPGTLLHGSRRGMAAMFLGVIATLVLLVLLVASANVAGLMLARAIGQRRQLAVRMAIGADRSRLVRHVITESLVLGAVGGLTGLGMTTLLVQSVESLVLLPGLELRLDLVPDTSVVWAIVALIAIAAVVSSITPAMAAARTDLVPLLKEGAGVAGGRRVTLLRNGVVVAQVAVSAVLLVAAGLLARSGQAASAIDLGFDRSRTFAIDLDLDPLGYSEPRGRTFFRLLTERIESLPDVAAVSLANRAPLDTSTPTARVSAGDVAMNQGTAPEVTYHVVGHRYFDTVGIRLVSGRLFGPADAEDAPRSAIVNETFVRRLWSGARPADALGRRFTVLPGTASDQRNVQGSFVITGVARDAKYRTLGEESQPHIYLPFEQHYAPSATVLVRHVGDAPPMQATHALITAVDPAVQGFFTRTLDEHTRVSLLPARVAAAASAGAGLIALALAVVGLYGLVAYGVSSRTTELGVRMALGASRQSIVRLVVVSAVRLAVCGCAVGFVVAVVAGRELAALLYGISPLDPLTFGGVAAAVAVVTVAASWLPAWRAARIDPLQALRH